MSTRITLVGAISAALLAAACAPEPEPVTITPTFDKLGNPVCPMGTMPATEAESGATVCVDSTMG
ncbi:MAG: hypothetical protein V2I65_02130 [Paracoccaceae bacterium]|jgi:hypothetical protein|nr:hypothetical protein [Paracoccaceae bacterium]